MHVNLCIRNIATNNCTWINLNPAFCKKGSSHPSAVEFPLDSTNRRVTMYDPKTKKYTAYQTCFGSHHLQFGYDANDTLSQAMAKSFYEGLFGFDKDMKLVNVLCESYDVSKDGLVYTFKLKKNIKFHDGTTFDATAVKASFDRVTDPANKLKRYTLFNRVAKTEVVDPYTARVTLKEPFSPFINVLAHPSAAMISPTARSPLALIVPTWAMSLFPLVGVESRLSSATTTSTLLSMPRLSSMGL